MILVRCFARYRILIGFESQAFPLPEPPTLARLLEDPALNMLPKDALLAINQTFVDRQATLKEGDEVALMPPVSGG